MFFPPFIISYCFTTSYTVVHPSSVVHTVHRVAVSAFYSACVMGVESQTLCTRPSLTELAWKSSLSDAIDSYVLATCETSHQIDSEATWTNGDLFPLFSVFSLSSFIFTLDISTLIGMLADGYSCLHCFLSFFGAGVSKSEKIKRQSQTLSNGFLCIFE